MDNITHTLVGVALAELAQPRAATSSERRLFIAAGVITANLPDIDLVYTRITPAPLGYLLHHRGHTHTIAGIAGLVVLAVLVCLLSPTVRALSRSARARLWVLLGVNLIGHVALDAFNTYGVHPLYPFDSTWYYGDAVSIFEPWLWMLLGIAAVSNAKSRAARFATGAPIAVLLAVVTVLGVVPRTAMAAIAIAAAALFAAARHTPIRTRSAAALTACALFMIGMFGLSRVVRREALAAIEPHRRGEIRDVILSPDPAVPLCWAVIGVEQDENAGELVLRRGTLSLLPAWHSPVVCASHRLTSGREYDLRSSEAVVWSDEVRQPLARLRDLKDSDCRVRGWLRFGRAPVIREGQLVDFRFDGGVRANFTALALAPAAGTGCPHHVPPWKMPRADLFDPRP